MLEKFRRYDVQATWAILCVTGAVIPFFGAAYGAFRNFDAVLGQICYKSGSPFLPAFLGCVGVSGLLAATGFILGLNSAGQRRNDKSWHSWAGFFAGGLITTLDLVLLIAFIKLRLHV